ncbi:MAG: hypothetical protein NTX45_20930 [Proteobacteria bacterium]|nr:hypothetical protein [Pseudomonadota bacterium]
MKTFSIDEAMDAGWEAFKSRIGFFIGLLLLFWLLQAIPQVVIQKIEIAWLAVILGFILLLFQYFLWAGMIKIILSVTDGRETRIGDLFSAGDVFVSYLLGSILFGLIMAVGILLLIVPGLIFSAMFLFYGFFIVDKHMGPVEALKASAALTKGVRWQLFGFILILSLLNVAGALLLVVGLFVTVPVSWVAIAFVYRKLLPQTQFV